MDHLFAPWRRAWVTSAEAGGSGDGGCLFCRVWSAPDLDADNFVVLRGATAFVMLNRYPYNAGHLLVAPVAHRGGIEDLAPAERAELLELAARAMGALGELFTPHGYNLGINQGRAAGAGIQDNVHLHVVPRWGGDTNFLSAVGETRVVSEDLVRARAALAERLSR